MFPSFGLVLCFLAAVSHSDNRGRVLKKSKSIPGTSIEYQRTSLCETTPGVTSYSGYVHLSTHSIPDLQGSIPFNISTFFWFFPARHNPENAQLALYLAGGPGESSTYAALTENGPCYPRQDGKSTTLNPFSFNENMHVLYVDQPNQVGFSYDELVDGVLDAMDNAIHPGLGVENLTNIEGRFSSQRPETTANTSTLAARAMWHFLQVWFAEFDEYYGPKNTISIWGNSYGAMFATSLATYIIKRNANLRDPSLSCTKASYQPIKVSTVGITNGCLDLDAQATSYGSYPYNNTYDQDINGKISPVHLYDDATSQSIIKAIEQPGGCREAIHKCRAAKASGDPNDTGSSSTVNTICLDATLNCFSNVQAPFYYATNVSDFDLAAPRANPYPPTWAATFLNQKCVRDQLGVPNGLNFTLNSGVVNTNFLSTGDPLRNGIQDLSYLIGKGVQVIMVYGDRDWKCNWIGAENLTLHIPWTHNLSDAGYTPLIFPSSSRITAVARQHTLLSFIRVFQSGHSPSWYSPQTVQTIFTRAMSGRNIVDGRSAGDSYVSRGSTDSWGWREKMPKWDWKRAECSLWNVAGTCSEAQKVALADGSAKIENWRVVQPAE